MVVTYRFVGDDDSETFLLGAREIEHERRPRGLLARSPPLGSAIIGSSKGDTVTYTAPNGKEMSGRDRRRRALRRLSRDAPYS